MLRLTTIERNEAEIVLFSSAIDRIQRENQVNNSLNTQLTKRDFWCALQIQCESIEVKNTQSKNTKCNWNCLGAKKRHKQLCALYFQLRHFLESHQQEINCGILYRHHKEIVHTTTIKTKSRSIGHVSELFGRGAACTITHQP